MFVTMYIHNVTGTSVHSISQAIRGYFLLCLAVHVAIHFIGIAKGHSENQFLFESSSRIQQKNLSHR